jgi:carbon-monoxide dehydrogenase large subunit
MGSQGVGARLLRKEDDRFLRGKGQYVGDIKLPGMKEVAFLRSPVAHARIRGFSIPPEKRSRVFTMDDLEGVKAIRAVTALPGFKPSEQFPLAKDKVRHVGELLVMCVADTRAAAEDLAGEVNVDFEELPALTEMLEARRPEAPRLHEHWSDNIYLSTRIEGEIDRVAAAAPVVIRRRLRMNRQCQAPLEGKGLVAWWDARLEQLVVYSATQLPHIMRSGLAECLGLEQGKLRVVAPDVGGGFGFKSALQPEEVAVAWLAMRCGHPVRWLEDRREHLIAAANAREHFYDLALYADREGKILGLDADVTVDVGAYSAWPFTGCLESAQCGSNLPGPYIIPVYRCATWSVATNKPPIVPYRGVARPGVCFAIELMVDALAREIGREPHEVRLANLVPASAMPYTNITGKEFDSGDYPQSLRRAVDRIDLAAVRARQKRGEPDGRLIGLGLATYTEQAAHGTKVYAGWGIAMVPGHEQATARVTPDGGLELRVGLHSHGQGLETTLAQIANEVLGIDPARVKTILGDTALTPFSTGTWGSRGLVMSGGAVSRACGALVPRLKAIAGHLLQCRADELSLRDGMVVGPNASVSLAEIARTWYLRPQELPEGVDARGLEATEGYKPAVDTGVFSYATHAAVVAVDPEIGTVEILDYVIVEDGGRLVNPMIVDGQIWGGAAQGIGTALYEEMPYDAAGQPLAPTLGDYLLPGFTEVPEIAIEHMMTLSPHTEFGVKGLGEGGAIAPPAALANAINDALRPLGVEIGETPMTPRRILAALQSARQPELAR